MDDLAHGRAASFAAIARREAKVERHIRLLAPLAFLSPRIVSALLDGTAPASLTITALAPMVLSSSRRSAMMCPHATRIIFLAGVVAAIALIVID
jgi:hypothetical protein